MSEHLASVLWINIKTNSQNEQYYIDTTQSSGPKGGQTHLHSYIPRVQVCNQTFFMTTEKKQNYELFNYDALVAERWGVQGKWGGCRVDYSETRKKPSVRYKPLQRSNSPIKWSWTEVLLEIPTYFFLVRIQALFTDKISKNVEKVFRAMWTEVTKSLEDIHVHCMINGRWIDSSRWMQSGVCHCSDPPLLQISHYSLTITINYLINY